LTFAGGLVVGVAASVSAKYLNAQPWSGLPSSMPFVILIIVLLVIPARRLPQQRFSFQQLARPPVRVSRTALGAVAGTGLVLVLVPQFVGSYLPVWINGLSYAVLFVSLALLVWLSGQISLCQLSFAAIGATTMAHLISHGMPWVFALLLAGLASVPVGALIAIPAVRLSGIYLALVTLGFGILMQSVVFQTDLMFGNNPTISAPRPHWSFLDGSNDKELYYLFLVIAALAFAIVFVVSRGRLGRVLRAMAQSPTMLNTHGLSTPVTRLIVFCLSAFLASIAGAMMITQYGSVSAATYPPIQSLLLLTVLVLCGTAVLISPILAAVLLAVVPGYVTSLTQDKQTLIFGLLAIAATLFLAWRPRFLSWLGQAARHSETRGGRSPVRDRQSPRLRPREASAADRELAGSRT
jgi:ABC-type branched-subunit amino acid transport system permease subunit